MKRILRKILKWLLIAILIPVAALLLALILTVIPVNSGEGSNRDKVVYLSTSGVHLDIVLPWSAVSPELKAGLVDVEDTQYFSFGWGDENFFLKTPTWGDLTIRNAFTALFLKSTSLMHLTRYPARRDSWTEVAISDAELSKLNAYLQQSFALDDQGNKMLLPGQGYTSYDDFYRATGSYSCFNTCNSWANSALKESGLKACLWTPFDFGVLWKHDG